MKRALALLVVFVLPFLQILARNPTGSEGRTYQIGEFAQGGVIIWLTPDGKHGIVSAIQDLTALDAGVPWSLVSYQTTMAFAQAEGLVFGPNYITPGAINTKNIIAQNGPGTGYAAGLAAAYSITVNGITYNDWFLPSITVLQLMYTFLPTINQVSVAHGGSPLIYTGDVTGYWSSCESYQSAAWVVGMSSGDDVSEAKNRSFYVRAVRSF